MKREVGEVDAILEAMVWTRHVAFRQSGHPVKQEDVIGVGAWSLLDRTPEAGDTVINVIHFEGADYFVYECKLPNEVDGDPVGFTLTFDAAQVRAAWASEEWRQ